MKNILVFLVILLSCISLSAQAAREITDVLLNDEAAATVDSGEKVAVVIHVSTKGGGNSSHWKSTSYILDGSTICVDTEVPNTHAGNHVDTFDITAPTVEGNYNISFYAHRKKNCDNGSASDIFPVVSGIVVSSGPAPDIFVDDISVNAGDDANFTITLTSTYSEDITLNYATSNGTAIAGGDYITASGTVTILKGNTSATVSTSTLPTGSGNFTLTLSNASAGNITDTTATGTIIKAASLVFDYRFDECSYSGASNEVIDQTGSYHAKTNGVPDPVSDAVINNSLNLTASDNSDWLNVPSGGVDGLDTFSLSFWVNTAKNKYQQEVFHALGDSTGDDELEVFLKDNDEVYIKVRNSSDTLTSTQVITDGSWHHIALTRVGTEVCLYVDSSEQECSNGVNSGLLSVTNSNAIIIGQEQDAFGGGFSNDQGFEGKIDEFQIYNGKLTSTEITAIYANQSARKNYDGSSRDEVECLTVPTTEYRFDETDYSEVVDEIVDSIGGFHGLAKDSQPAEGKVCNAIELSATGISNYAVLNKNSLTGKTDFTVSLWAKSNKTSNQSILSGAGSRSSNELIMWFTSHTRFRPYLAGGQNGTLTIDSIAANSWHHLVWTREGSQSCLFVDKVLQGCVTQSTSTLNIQSLILGQEQDRIGGGFSSSQAFDGLIDELLIYDKAISTADIATIYDNQDAGLGFDGSPRDCPVSVSPTPVLDHRFDESSWADANSVLDSSGNDYHASAVNVTPTEGFICKAANLSATGTSDYLNLDHTAINGLKDFTLSAWIKTPRTTAQTIMSVANSTQSNEAVLYYENSTTSWSTLREDPYFDVSTKFTVTNISTNTWKHHVWTRKANVSNGESCLYIDNVLQGCSTHNNGEFAIDVDATGFILGQEQDSLGGGFESYQGFSGLIDEVLLFDKVLSTTEINDIYTNQNAGNNYDGTSRTDCEPLLHHYEIIHDGNGLTCAAETVIINACANSDCSTLSTNSVTLDFQVIAPASTPITKSSPTFTGSTSVNFNHTTVETLTLSVANATTTASSGIVCVNGSGSSCDMSFAEAGFLLTLDNHQSCTTPNLTIKAVRLSDSGLDCAAAYTGEQSVDFVFNYANPTSGETLPVLNGISMAGNTVTQNRTVNFDGTGTANLSFNYQDAGQIRIDVSDAASSGLTSSSVTTVVSPAKLMLTSSNANCASDYATCSIFKVAGEEFNLNVTAACNDDDNTVTKNFEMNNIPLTVNTVAPNVDNSVSLGVKNVNIEAVDDGSHNINNQTISEVGVFTITAKPPLNGYFGVTIDPATSANIGRFIPAAFVLDSKFDGSLQVSPDAPSFAYIGQKDGSDGAIKYLLQPDFTIKAVNSDDVVTKNYAVNDDSDITKDFMTLTAAQVSLAPITTDTVKKGVDDTLIDLDAVISGSLVGDSSTGLITFTMDTSNHFTYQHIANSKVDHFTADIDIIVNSINDGEGTLLADTNGVTVGVLKMDPDGVGVRFGRWYIENAYGPETSDLPLPMQIQYWNGSQFITNTLEGLTVYDGTDVDNYTKDNAGLSPALGIAVVGVDGTGPTFSSGVGQLLLEKPTDGSQGQIRLTYDIVPAWLQYDWDGDGNYDNNPSGVGAFGLFRGNDRIIYQREVNN